MRKKFGCRSFLSLLIAVFKGLIIASFESNQKEAK